MGNFNRELTNSFYANLLVVVAPRVGFINYPITKLPNYQITNLPNYQLFSIFPHS